MLSQTPKNFRTKFLLLFTKELIENSVGRDIFRLEHSINRKINEEKIKTKKIAKIVKERIRKPELRQIPAPLPRIRRMPEIAEPQKLIIPQNKLPEDLAYLKPTPTEEEIDLKKLNPLIKDRAVNMIECKGPNEKILVKGKMGIKKTSITLNKEEINQIVKEFSIKAKIPVQEGVFRVAVGRFIFSGIISEITGSKFIIQKMRQ